MAAWQSSINEFFFVAATHSAFTHFASVAL